MNILQAIVLGIVQGVCEFLPISSSGHLVLMQTIFGISPESMLFFDVMLHVGTLVAVVSVYWRTIVQLVRRIFSRSVGMLLLATIPTVAIVLLFEGFLEVSFSGKLLGVGFLLTALVLTLAGRVRPGKKQMATMGVTDALGVGIAQGVSALLPGLSRSGSTISAGLLLGVDSRAAADFAFLLSIPAILGSVVFSVPDVIKSGLVGTDWVCVVVGASFAALSGFLSIKMVLRLVTEGKLKGFAIYTFALGVLVLADQFIFNFFFTAPF